MCLTSLPGLSFSTHKIKVGWWLWRMASLDLVVTVTKPSWPVGQEARGSHSTTATHTYPPPDISKAMLAGLVLGLSR